MKPKEVGRGTCRSHFSNEMAVADSALDMHERDVRILLEPQLEVHRFLTAVALPSYHHYEWD